MAAVGVPLRATVSSFGPILLSKVLGLNETQESTLGLIFHYCDTKGLPLLDLADLRSVVSYLTSDEGKPELKELGGVSSASAGVAHRAAAIARAVKRIGVRISSPWAKHGCCPLGSTKNRGRAGLTRFGASATAPA